MTPLDAGTADLIRRRRRSIALIAVAEVAVLGLWFSATAAVPDLAARHGLSGWQLSLFTSSVQLGFAVGSLVSTFLGLADRIEPRRLFAAAAVAGATANGAILLLDPASALVPCLRFLTGAALAGVYPVGMKLAASWAGVGGRQDMGLLVGLLVGSLCLGSASPHLFNAFGGGEWRTTLILATLAALGAAAIVLFAEVGPRFATGAAFKRELIRRAWDDKPIRLAILGYLGHMWELYAVWAWVGSFLAVAFAAGLVDAQPKAAAALATFMMVGAGAIGSLAAGALADRLGRTAITSACMVISAACCLGIGLLLDGPLWLLLAALVVWGVTIAADSAQFSTAVAELSEPGIVGTMLTLQTALGFLLTLVTIHLMPAFVAQLGWRWAFAPLALGPLLGVWAMLRLRFLPDAMRLAGGRR